MGFNSGFKGLIQTELAYTKHVLGSVWSFRQGSERLRGQRLRLVVCERECWIIRMGMVEFPRERGPSMVAIESL